MSHTLTHSSDEAQPIITLEAQGTKLVITRATPGDAAPQVETRDFPTEQACQEDAARFIAEQAALGYVDDFDEEAYIEGILEDIEMGDLLSMAMDDAVKSIYKLQHEILTPLGRERLLAQGIGIAMRAGDKDFLLFCLQRVPENVTWDILAYNLACYYATERNKPVMLHYIRTAVAAGKDADQFMQDTDFTDYHCDPEFLEATGSITKKEAQQRISNPAASVTPMSLNDILAQLCTGESKIRNAGGMLQTLHAQDPQSIQALLTHADKRYRVLAAAWLRGQSDHPAEQLQHQLLDDVAFLYLQRLRSEKSHAKGLRSLAYFEHIPGISYFIQQLKKQPVDYAANENREHKDEYTIIENAVALSGHFPALYRIYSNLFTFRMAERKDLHAVFMRCTAVGPSLTAFKESHPWAGLESELADAADEYGNIEKLDALLKANLPTALDSIRELHAFDAYDYDHRYFMAYRLWKNDLGKEIIPTATEVLQNKLYKSFSPKKGKYTSEEIAPLIEWIFGQREGTLETVMPAKPCHDMSFAKTIAYFWDVAEFPVRYLHLAFEVEDYSALMYTSGLLDTRVACERLMASGVSKHYLLKKFISFIGNHDMGWLFGGWQYLLGDTAATLAAYNDIDSAQRKSLLNTYYLTAARHEEDDDGEAPYTSNNDLMVHALLHEPADGVIKYLLEGMLELKTIQAQMPAHPQASAVQKRLEALAQHANPDIAQRSKQLLKAIYNTEVEDDFVVQSKAKGLPVSAPLMQLLAELAAVGTKQCNVIKNLDALHAENPAYFSTALTHPNACYRLLAQAYLYRRQADDSLLQNIAKDAAEVYAHAGNGDLTEDVKILQRFTEYPAITTLVNALEKYQHSENPVMYPDSVMANAVALANNSIAFLYRLVCLPFGSNRHTFGNSHNRTRAVHAAYDICHEETTRKEFEARFPMIAAEDILAGTMSYLQPPSTYKEEAIALLQQHPQQALTLIREWPKVNEHFFFAALLWEQQQGHEWIDEYAARHKEITLRLLLPDNRPEDIARLLDWAYDEQSKLDIEDIGPLTSSDFWSIINTAYGFLPYKPFALRLYRYLAYYENQQKYRLDTLCEDILKTDTHDFLLASGVPPKEAARLKLCKLDGNERAQVFSVLMANREHIDSLFRNHKSDYWECCMAKSFKLATQPGELEPFLCQYLKADAAKDDYTETMLALPREYLRESVNAFAQKDALIRHIQTGTNSEWKGEQERAKDLVKILTE